MGDLPGHTAPSGLASCPMHTAASLDLLEESKGGKKKRHFSRRRETASAVSLNRLSWAQAPVLPCSSTQHIPTGTRPAAKDLKGQLLFTLFFIIVLHFTFAQQ